MTASLSLRGISRTYRVEDGPALDGLSLEVPPGSCVALVGPSGSGKSTVARIVAGLEEPDEGDVLIDGRSVRGAPAESRGAALVFQRPLLFPHLSVLDNVAFAARAAGASRRASRADASRYLDLVQLGGYGRRRVHELSGGQEQRVALARALASRPRVLLLDEPFSALDASLRADMHDLLGELRAVMEPTVVLVTHDLDEAAALADSVAVLSGGRLLQHTDPRTLFLRPASLEVSRMTGCRNEVTGVVDHGVHHSALGAIALPDGFAHSNGAAVLLLRQEAVGVTGAADADADAYGVVGEVRSIGARTSVTVTVGQVAGEGQVEIVVEVPPGRAVERGQQVGLVFPEWARSIVLLGYGSGSSLSPTPIASATAPVAKPVPRPGP